MRKLIQALEEALKKKKLKANLIKGRSIKSLSNTYEKENKVWVFDSTFWKHSIVGENN